ncbi:MAG: polysaccharide biosynthesis C-terminal domain-containing protein, partial [Clostridia bacterium]|nr:polysaccharide biosynthesis C-terminal domain-containing protein [Clostridia bacterium]
MKHIGLNEHFTVRKLLRFTAPSIVMAIFTSVYTIVDGLFVSNAVGDAAFAGLNLIFPVVMILGAIGLMLGSGGSALIAKTFGEGDRERANGYFSCFLIVIAISGVVFGGIGIAVIRPVAELLGRNATRETVRNAVLYGTVFLCGMPFLMLQFSFQSFMVTAEKATLGFWITVAAGVLNGALDALFILGFRWGLAGAAAATVVGQVAGGIVPVFYFARKNNGSLLRLAKPKFEWKALLRACTNGSSELLTNISSSVVNMLYN